MIQLGSAARPLGKFSSPDCKRREEQRRNNNNNNRLICIKPDCVPRFRRWARLVFIVAVVVVDDAAAVIRVVAGKVVVAVVEPILELVERTDCFAY